MAINLGGGFHIGSKQPIDDRLIMSKDEMLNINENTFPDVYMCICSDDGAIYTFNVNNEVNAETGKFRIAEGGGSVTDCYTKSEIDTKLDDYTKTEDLHTVATTGSYNDLSDKPNILEIADIIDDTNTTATDKTLSSSKIIDEIQSIIDDTFDNKEVLDLLSESDTGKLQYNGVTIGSAGGASTADAVEYINDAISVTNVEDALNKLIADYYYVAPSVTSFTANPNGGTYEIGATVKAPITFNWSYNKDITTQTLTDCPLADNTIRTATYNTDITTNKTFTLSASDGTKTVTKSIAYSFTNKVWFGSAAEGTYDDAFILGLATGKLQTSKSGTYTVTVADREYFFIAMPQSYNNSDTLTGKIGGFETEFGKVATVNHTNASGYATNYNIYKSTNASLGAISFII